MMKLKVVDNLPQALALIERMPGLLNEEMSRALNRASHGVRTDEVKMMSQRGIPKSELEDWKFHRSTPDDMEAEAVLSGRRLGAEKFATGLTSMTGRTQGGVSINFLGKAIRFSHAFGGMIFDSSLKVWSRKPGATPKVKSYTKAGVTKRMKGRFPVQRMMLTSVPQIADDEEYVKVVIQNAEGRWLKQFDHLLDRLLEGHS